MKKLAAILIALSVLFCGVGPVMVAPAYADVCSDADDTMKEVLGCPNPESPKKTIGSIGNYWISVVLSFVGLIAVAVIIIGGISYTKSMGDPGKTKRARDTIIYGVVGLIVCLLAYAIVALVTANISMPADDKGNTL